MNESEDMKKERKESVRVVTGMVVSQVLAVFSIQALPPSKHTPSRL